MEDIFSNSLFLLPITIGPLFLIVGTIMLKWPPTEINSLYGYRMPSSMKSQERWDFAQRLSAKEMIKAGFILFALCPIGFFLEVESPVDTFISLGEMLLVTIVMIVRTESGIKKQFGS